MSLAKNPHLSVVIPLYQKARHVRTALADAFRSCRDADTPFELVVVDDGSTDGSGDVVRGWADEAAGQAAALRLLTQENRGAPRGPQRGLAGRAGRSDPVPGRR
ncbi:glycosyl transferase family 2 [Gemmobacter caeni]|uniref:Glycosyl transferase family 2 n=1 Tax=Gemmobacter caeni TaxID=589035 RepID=A0A2T6B8K1_9RHOB|nr:glycosyltransferase [Gemmobacter caeni]PTX52348.1 glycosyl transferase family 2 [Gemmobacter caeni]TWJ02720.1 glycosyl transferase family 2 [Gemmobacter caeni]